MKLKSVKDVHERMLRRQAAIDLPARSIAHQVKSISTDELIPGQRIERFIIVEYVAHFTAMRVTGTAASIGEMVQKMRDSRQYIDVIVTERVCE